MEEFINGQYGKNQLSKLQIWNVLRDNSYDADTVERNIRQAMYRPKRTFHYITLLTASIFPTFPPLTNLLFFLARPMKKQLQAVREPSALLERLQMLLAASWPQSGEFL